MERATNYFFLVYIYFYCYTMTMDEVFLQSIYSDGSCNFVSNPLPKVSDFVTIAIQMLNSDAIKSVLLQAKYNGVSIPKKMTLLGVSNGLCRYEITVQTFEKEFDYFFIIVTNDGVYYYNQAGVATYLIDESRDFRILTNYEQCQWVKNAVFYQIFPERFCNGRPEISVKDGEYTFDGYETIAIKNWYDIPKEYNEAHCLDFYGGDLWGVIDKIPYLKKLGVTALYLNPIFYAATVHKYDCLDYFHVDPHFGGDEALAALSNALHENGMKIMLDVSINHTGIANKWFNKDGVFFPKSEGAYNNPDSVEREYYYFNSDNTYKSWFDVETLPTLNYQSAALRNRLYRDKDSVVKKWLKPPYNIDAWRFDVADTMARNNEIQLAHEVWPEIRHSIKEENPNAYILAEDWSDCSEFLNGNEWDSQMNYYGSTFPIRQFYGQNDFHCMDPDIAKNNKKLLAEDLALWLTGFQSRLPYQILQEQFNLLDSHDTPRFHNDTRITSDYVKGALIMLFTLPGCTNIYYGDEADIAGRVQSMEGCRYPMPWNKDIENCDAYKLYHTLCTLKTSEDAFCNGGFKILWAKCGVIAWARFTQKDIFVTIASNCDKTVDVKLPVGIFGDSFLKKEQIFDILLKKYLTAEYDCGKLVIKVDAGKSYLLKL